MISSLWVTWSKFVNLQRWEFSKSNLTLAPKITHGVWQCKVSQSLISLPFLASVRFLSDLGVQNDHSHHFVFSQKPPHDVAHELFVRHLFCASDLKFLCDWTALTAPANWSWPGWGGIEKSEKRRAEENACCSIQWKLYCMNKFVLLMFSHGIDRSKYLSFLYFSFCRGYAVMIQVNWWNNWFITKELSQLLAVNIENYWELALMVQGE